MKKIAKPKRRQGLSSAVGKLSARAASAYYGTRSSMRDMKLIAITGTTGKVTVAHFVHEIMKTAGLRVAVFASDDPFNASALHKFISDAWKAEADYVIITTPAKSLEKNTFFGLPVFIAAMTNFAPAGLSDMTAEEYLDSEKTLFQMKPEITILNADDANFSNFSSFHGEKKTLIYGFGGNDVKILNHKLYKKGVEATLSTDTGIFAVASFLTGEIIIPYMAAAAAIGLALGLKDEAIINGIAAYEG